MSSKDRADVTASSRRSVDDSTAVDFKSVKVFARPKPDSAEQEAGQSSEVKAGIPQQRKASSGSVDSSVTDNTKAAKAGSKADIHSAGSDTGSRKVFAKSQPQPPAAKKPSKAKAEAKAKADARLKPGSDTKAKAKPTKKVDPKAQDKATGKVPAQDVNAGQSSPGSKPAKAEPRTSAASGKPQTRRTDSKETAGTSQGTAASITGESPKSATSTKAVKPAQSKPVQSKSAQSKPAKSKSAQSKPVRSKAADSAPEQSKSVSSSSAKGDVAQGTVEPQQSGAAQEGNPATSSRAEDGTAAGKEPSRSRRRAARQPSRPRAQSRNSTSQAATSTTVPSQGVGSGSSDEPVAKQRPKNVQPAKTEPAKAQPAKAQPKAETTAEKVQDVEVSAQATAPKKPDAAKTKEPKTRVADKPKVEAKKPQPAKSKPKKAEPKKVESKKPESARGEATTSDVPVTTDAPKTTHTSKSDQGTKKTDAKTGTTQAAQAPTKPVAPKKPTPAKAASQDQEPKKAGPIKPAAPKPAAAESETSRTKTHESDSDRGDQGSAGSQKASQSNSAEDADSSPSVESKATKADRKPVAPKKPATRTKPASTQSKTQQAGSTQPTTNDTKLSKESVNQAGEVAGGSSDTGTSDGDTQGEKPQRAQTTKKPVPAQKAARPGSKTPAKDNVDAPQAAEKPSKSRDSEKSSATEAPEASRTAKSSRQEAKPAAESRRQEAKPAAESRRQEAKPAAEKNDTNSPGSSAAAEPQTAPARRLPPVKPVYSQKPRGTRRRAALRMQPAANPKRFAAPAEGQSQDQESAPNQASSTRQPAPPAAAEKTVQDAEKLTPQTLADSAATSQESGKDHDSAAKPPTANVEVAEPVEQDHAESTEASRPTGDSQASNSDADAEHASKDQDAAGTGKPSPLQAALAELRVAPEQPSSPESGPDVAAETSEPVASVAPAIEDPIAELGLTPTIFVLDDNDARKMPSLSDRMASATRRRRDSEHLLRRAAEEAKSPAPTPAGGAGPSGGTPLPTVDGSPASIQSARPLPQLRPPQQGVSPATSGARPLPNISHGPRPINQEALARAQAHKPKLEPLGSKRDLGVVTPATRFTRRDKPGSGSEHVSIVVGPPQLQSNQPTTPPADVVPSARTEVAAPAPQENTPKTHEPAGTPDAAQTPPVPEASGPKPLPIPQQLSEFAGTIGDRLAASVRTLDGESMQLDHEAVDSLASMLDEGDGKGQDYADVLGQQAFLGSLHEDNEFAGDDVPAAANIQQTEANAEELKQASSGGVFETPSHYATQPDSSSTQPQSSTDLASAKREEATSNAGNAQPAPLSNPLGSPATPAGSAAVVTQEGQQPLPKLPSRSVGESLAAVRATHSPDKATEPTDATPGAAPDVSASGPASVASAPAVPTAAHVSDDASAMANPTAPATPGDTATAGENAQQASASGVLPARPGASSADSAQDVPAAQDTPGAGKTASPSTISLAKRPTQPTAAKDSASASSGVGNQPESNQPEQSQAAQGSSPQNDGAESSASSSLPTRGSATSDSTPGQEPAAQAAEADGPSTRQMPAVPVAESPAADSEPPAAEGDSDSPSAAAPESAAEPHFREKAEIVFAADDEAASLPTRTPKPVSKTPPKKPAKPAPRRGPDADAPVARGGFAAAFVAGAAKAAAKSDDAADGKDSPNADKPSEAAPSGGGSGHWMDQMPFAPGTQVKAEAPAAAAPEPEPELPRTDADLPQRRVAADDSPAGLPQRGGAEESTSGLPQRAASDSELPSRTPAAGQISGAEELGTVPDPTVDQSEHTPTPAATTARPAEVDEVGPQAAGWYDDPSEQGWQRYFDGMVWTDQRVQAVDMVSAHAAGEPGVSDAVAAGSSAGAVDFSNGSVTESLYDEYGEVREDTTLAALAHMTQAMPQGLADRNDVLATIDAAEVAAARAARRNIRPKMGTEKSTPTKKVLGNVVPKNPRLDAKAAEQSGTSNTVKLALIIFIVMLFALAVLMYGVDILLT